MVLTQSLLQQSEKPLASVLQGFDYASLDPENQIIVQQRTAKIRTLMRRTTQDTFEIGQMLILVKEQLGHGRFRNWLKAEFDWSVRTAARFMQVATRFKSANLAHLNIAASALYILSESSTPDEAHEEALELAKQGEDISYAKAKDIINQHKESAMTVASKPDTIDAPSEAWEGGAYPPAESREVVQTREALCTAVVKPFEDKLPEEKEAPAYSQTSNHSERMAPATDSNDYTSQEQAKIKMQSLFEIGQYLYITNFERQDYKCFGEVTEFKEVADTEIQVTIRMSTEPVENYPLTTVAEEKT